MKNTKIAAMFGGRLAEPSEILDESRIRITPRRRAAEWKEKRYLLAGLLLSAAFFLSPGESGPAEQEARGDALTSLVEAERAFSSTSEAQGIREAFLTYLASEAIVFRPAPVEGRPVYENMAPDNPALLVWEPEVAEASAAGDLGYTSGPYRLKRNRAESDFSGFGHYVTIWREEYDGTWKVVLDIGISHGRQPSAPAGTVLRIASSSGVTAPGTTAGRDAGLRALFDKDSEFSKSSGRFGYLTALMDLATDDVRVYRAGYLPRTGRERVKEIVPLRLGKMTVTKAGAGISISLDLAYTYGTYSITAISGEVETSSYMKIWRRETDGSWKVCLDISLPITPS